MDATRVITPNQLVAHNLRRARELRGWTQVEAAQRCAPYLGEEWSRVVWSAAERSIDGNRVRHFTADDLFAFARGFDLPVGWFFIPPDPDDSLMVSAGHSGSEPLSNFELLSVALGVSSDDMRERLAALVSPASEGGAIPDDSYASLAEFVERQIHVGATQLLARRRADVEKWSEALESTKSFLDDLLTDVADAESTLAQLHDLGVVNVYETEENDNE